ncbi:MAG: sigma-70 family RNA polymerase sigma factor [Solirubrobacterales bacterium]
MADEKDLWPLRDEDPRVREELVSRYLPFARRLAGKYRNRWESADDLQQVASLGLLNAVLRFDPSKGTPFAAFASPTIHGELKRYFRDRVWIVRVPRDLQEEILEVEHATDELSAQLHRMPTDAEIDEATGLGEGAASRASAARADRVPSSLDSTLDDGQTPLERFGSVDSSFAAIEDSDALRGAMSELDQDARTVMRLRFVEDMTQSEIADRIGCSQMHISRVLRRSVTSILDKLEQT